MNRNTFINDDENQGYLPWKETLTILPIYRLPIFFDGVVPENQMKHYKCLMIDGFKTHLEKDDKLRVINFHKNNDEQLKLQLLRLLETILKMDNVSEYYDTLTKGKNVLELAKNVHEVLMIHIGVSEAKYDYL